MHGDIDGDSFLALSVAEDRLVGVLGVGRPRDVRAVQTLIKSGPYLPRSVLGAEDIDLVGPAADPQRFAASAPAHR